MVRTISKLIDVYPYLLAFASRRRKILVMVRSRGATTVLGKKRMGGALTMLCQSVVGLIRFRERILLAQGRRPMEDHPQGAGVTVPQL